MTLTVGQSNSAAEVRIDSVIDQTPKAAKKPPNGFNLS